MTESFFTGPPVPVSVTAKARTTSRRPVCSPGGRFREYAPPRWQAAPPWPPGGPSSPPGFVPSPAASPRTRSAPPVATPALGDPAPCPTAPAPYSPTGASSPSSYQRRTRAYSLWATSRASLLRPFRPFRSFRSFCSFRSFRPLLLLGVVLGALLGGIGRTVLRGAGGGHRLRTLVPGRERRPASRGRLRLSARGAVREQVQAPPLRPYHQPRRRARARLQMDLRAHRRQRLHVNPPGVIQLRLVLGGGHGRVEPVLHHGGAPLFRFPPGFLPGVLRLLRPPLGALILFAHRGAPLQSGLAGGPLRLPAFLRRRLRAEPAALSAPLRGAAVRVPALCRAVEVCPGRRTRRGLLRDLGAPPEPGRDRRRSATLQGYPLLRGVVPALGAPIADGSAVGAGLDQGPVPVLGAALGTPSAPEHGTLRCARDVVVHRAPL
eukprot:1190629-Prorocentrum_minimum.AAC.8